MSTTDTALHIPEGQWALPGHGTEVVFNWEYDRGRPRLLALYEQGKDKQWNASRRIDWSIDVDMTDQGLMPDYQVPIFGSQTWDRLNRTEQDEVRHHVISWMFSQFLHGEQGALICAAKIVETVPDIDSKFYAATQVIDEARHVELYARYLNTKLELTYPINPHLGLLLDQTISDTRWDFTYLGMQMMIESVALGAFGVIRDLTTEPLAKSLNAYVMGDEARHVAFGIAALQDVYADMTSAELAEREEFAIEAAWLLRNRFMAREVWERLGFDVDACAAYMDQSLFMAEFRKRLFSRLVPNLKRIGLWGPKIQRTFEEMGVLGFQDLDPDSMGEDDQLVADELELLLATRREQGPFDAAPPNSRNDEIAATIAAAG